jgi:hypothetical protein
MAFWLICFDLCVNVNPQNKCNDFRLIKPQGLYVVLLYISTCISGMWNCIIVTGHICTALKLRKVYMCIMSNSEIFPAHKRGVLSWIRLERFDYSLDPMAGPVPRIMQVSLFYKTMCALLRPKTSREHSRNTLLSVSHHFSSSVL